MRESHGLFIFNILLKKSNNEMTFPILGSKVALGAILCKMTSYV